MRHLPLLVLALFALACPPRGGGGGGGGDDDDDGGDWNLEIDNQSSNTMEVVRHRPCPSDDPEDWNEIALPPSGLAPGDSERLLMPAPSCYALLAEGEGCIIQWQTGSMEIGVQVKWTIEDSDLDCMG
jgi:hypothetical protein